MCMSMCMRTNIVLDDELMGEAMRYAHSRSKRGVVQEALATYVATKRAEARRASYSERLAALRRRVGAERMSESSAAVIRRDRERAS